MKNKNYLYYIVFVAISFIVFHFQLDLKLSYHQQQPLFLLNIQSFYASLLNPGGLISYVADFLTALYAYNILGAFSPILLITLLMALIYSQLQKYNQSLLSFIFLSAVWLITVLLTFDHSFHIENLIVLIAAFAISKIWFNIFKLSKKTLIVFYSSVFSVLSFYLLGGLCLLLSSSFTLLYILFSSFDKNKKIYASALIIINQIVLPFLFVKLFFNILPLNKAYFSDYNLTPLWFVLVAIIAVVIFYSFKNEITKALSAKVKLIAFSFTCLLVLVIPYATLNKNVESAMEADYNACLKNWDKVIDIIKTEKLTDQKSVFIYNRALLNTGLLLDNCFDIPQKYGSDGLFLDPLSDPSNLMLVSDLYYDLGLINESKHWGHEAYTLFHKQPRILKRLVETNIINGKYSTALKYILILKKSLVDRSWAKEYERIINYAKPIEDYPELYDKQKSLPTVDFFVSSDNPVENLLNLLNQPKQNPMALEYLTTYYLLNHKIGYVLKNISNFRSYNYKYLPKHLQEAITVYLMQTKDYKLNMFDYQLSKDQIPKLKTYVKLTNSANKGNKKAKQKLDLQFSNTYWYYMQIINPLK